MEANGEKGRGTASLPEREYVSLEEESRTTQTKGAEGGVKPSMAEVFGPGGLLERCMIGGYEHRRGEVRRGGGVHGAFVKDQHVVGGGGEGRGERQGYVRAAS